jgi:Uncharacterized membrane protein
MKKVKKWIAILIIVFILSLFFINGMSANVKRVTEDRIVSITDLSKMEKVDCILVLGCEVKSDGTPSPMLNDRLELAGNVYKTGIAPKILVSGDHANVNYNEVRAMKDYYIKNAIAKDDDIFMDHAGFSTYDSIYRAKKIFKVDSMIIVTHRYHMYRALYLAKKLGIDAYGVACEDLYDGARYREFREVLARNKDYFKSYLRPDAEVMGEEIDIRGSGKQTNDE